MKKILLIFLCLVSFPAIAEEKIFISSSIVEEVINTFVSPENRQSSADVYEREMDRTTGEISIMGLYKVCIASGFDIQTETGYQSCRQFVFKMLEDVEKQSGDKDTVCTQTMNGVWVNGKCLGRDGQELVYGRACSTNKGKCIKVFDSLQTQPAVGKEFIYEYGRKNGLNLTCSNEQPETRRGITSPLGQDYIKCSAGGVAYEFEFDDLKQEIGTKSVKSENTAICALYGGTDKGESDNWFQCETSQENCGKITSFLSRIGRNGMYQGYCRLSTEAPNTSVPFLNTLPGVDNRVFYQAGIQVRSDVAKQQLEEYLRGIYPNEANITCGPGIQELNQANSLKDYIMTCTVGGKKVDFVFDDLTEQNDKQVNIDLTGMKCIVSGGNYDGKYCKWLTEKECLDLGKSIEGGTKWDKGAGACILNNAKKYNDLKNGLIMAGGTVAVVAITVASGGTSTIVLAAVAVDAGFNIAFAAFERLQETNPQHRALSFIKDAQNCNDSTCARFVIQSHFARLDEIVQDLSDDMQDAIMIKFDELSSLLTQEEFEEALEASNLKVGDYALKAGGIMLFLGGIFATPEKALTRMFGKAPRMLGKLTVWTGKVAKNSAKLAVTSKFKLMNVEKELDFVKVYKMLDSETGFASYLKYTDADELEYTLKASQFRPSSRKPILHMVSVNSVDQAELAKVVQANNLPEKASDQVYLMTNEVPQGATPYVLAMGDGHQFLKGKGITKSEADQLIQEIREMNAAGIYHGDINSNMFISRDSNGDLQAYVIDFQGWSRKGNVDDASAATKTALYGAVESTNGGVVKGKIKMSLGIDPVLRPAAENSLGHDYYRIAIDNNTDVEKMVQDMKSMGFYVSSNIDKSGNRFLGVSDKNIFGAWENSSSNWLKSLNKADKVIVPEASDINILKQKASKSFDTYLQNYKKTGKSVGLPVERLTDAEWENLNKVLMEQDNIFLVRKGEYMAFRSVAETASSTQSALSKYGAVLRRGTENSLGHDYYRIAVNNNTDVKRIVQELQEQGFYVSSNMDKNGNRFLGVAEENVFGAWENLSSNWLKNTGRTVGQTGRALEGFYKYGDGLDISTRRYTEYQAEQLTNNLINNGYYATNIGVRGTAEGDEYIVIAASKEQINNLPYQVVESNGTLYRQLNKSRQINSAVDKVGTEITRFGRHKAVLQDIGVIDGRPIAVVKVDKAYIPFYVSTGTAGKTNIPTGRWEVFGGIAPNGWFAKGSEANIINQYGSAEFTEIANALDRSIGDLRDMELVLETAGRQSLGGIGNVAEASDFKSISTDLINRTTGGGVYGLYQIMDYLRQLR